MRREPNCWPDANGTFENGAIGFEQALHILDGGKAARRDDRNVHAVCKFKSLFEVDAFENAVTVNISKYNGRHAHILKALSEFNGCKR